MLAEIEEAVIIYQLDTRELQRSAPFELLFSFHNKISAEELFFLRNGEIKSKILCDSTFRGENSAQSDSTRD